MCNTKKPWILPLLAGASCLLSLSGITQVLPVTAQVTTPQGALSPNDPAAKLDPSLLNVPSIVPPAPTNTPTTNSAAAALNQAVGHDSVTGTTQLIPESSAPTTSSTSPSYGGRAPLGSENSSGGPVTNSVIGADNRILVSNTAIYPWRAQAKLYVTFPNGKTYGCSGTLIQTKYLLTAGHCVYNKAYGGWYKKLEAIPGLNGTYKPYGSAYGKYVRSYQGWTKSKSPDHDLALVTLDKTIGSTTGYFGYGYYPTINGVTSYISGYPYDKYPGGTKQYYHYGKISSSTTYRVYYPIDTYDGQSGSGVYRIISGKRYVFAVHGYGGSTSNSGARINSTKFNNIKAWIASGT